MIEKGLILTYLSIPIFWMIYLNKIPLYILEIFSSIVLIIFIFVIYYNFYKYEIKKNE